MFIISSRCEPVPLSDLVGLSCRQIDLGCGSQCLMDASGYSVLSPIGHDRTSFAKLSSVQEVLAWSYYMSVFMHVCNDLMHTRLQMETRVVVLAFVVVMHCFACITQLFGNTVAGTTKQCQETGSCINRSFEMSTDRMLCICAAHA
jgi:hypothetical protein